MQQGAPHHRYTLLTGGIGIVIVVFFLVSNIVLGGGVVPGASATAAEIADAYQSDSTPLQWEAAMRYVELFFLPVFVALLLLRFSAGSDAIAVLRLTALAGVAWVISIGTVANTAEMLLLLERSALSEQPELARTLNLILNGMFQVALFGHALWISSVCLAGLVAGSLPRWLCMLGFVQAVGAFVSTVGMVYALRESGPPDIGGAVGITFLAVWLLAASIYLLISGLRSRSRVQQAQRPAGP